MSTGIGIGVGIGIGGVKHYDPVAESYFTRAGITDGTEKQAANTFVKNCRSNQNIWNALSGGAVYLVSPTSYGASLHNLLSSSFQITTGVAPLFSTNGWSFNGSTQYLRTGFIPLTHATANQGFSLFYVRSLTAANTAILGSGNAGGTTQWSCTIKNAANNATFNAYNSGTLMTVANTNTSGTYVYMVASSSSRYIRRNGASLGTSAVAIGGTLPNLELYIGARNTDGAASLFCTTETSTVIQGIGALSTSDADTLRTYVDLYNANVISGGR